MTNDEFIKLLYSGDENRIIQETDSNPSFTNIKIPNFSHNGAVGKDVYPIHVASALGYSNVVKHLIEKKGIPIEAKSDSGGFSPLHFASANNQLATCKYLLSKGADIDAQSSNKRTPLYIATDKGFEDVVKFLLSKKAKLDILADISGEKLSPKDIAMRKGSDNMRQLYTSKSNKSIIDKFKFNKIIPASVLAFVMLASVGLFALKPRPAQEIASSPSGASVSTTGTSSVTGTSTTGTMQVSSTGANASASTTTNTGTNTSDKPKDDRKLEGREIPVLSRTNSTINLTREIASNKFRLALGWNSYTDLDLSIVPKFASRSLVDPYLASWFGNLVIDYAYHSEDDVVGMGGGKENEYINVELNKVPADIKTLYVSVYCYTTGVFSEYSGVFFRLYDDKNHIKISADLNENPAPRGSTHLTAIKFTRLATKNSEGKSDWNVEYVGKYDRPNNHAIYDVIYDVIQRYP